MNESIQVPPTGDPLTTFEKVRSGMMKFNEFCKWLDELFSGEIIQDDEWNN